MKSSRRKNRETKSSKRKKKEEEELVELLNEERAQSNKVHISLLCPKATRTLIVSSLIFNVYS